MNHRELKALLDRGVELCNRPFFVDSDPVFVPHRFSAADDREIAGFLVASIAWGTRKGILRSGMRLMELMDMSPAGFVRGFSENDLMPFRGFVHRTFRYADLETFLYALKHIYQKYGSLEQVFFEGYRRGGSMKEAIVHFRNEFFQIPHLLRTRKHVSDPGSGSAAKRINMFLRWMVRKDNRGVDLGIWNAFSPGQLFCPLDVHSGRMARQLGLLTRKQNDWKAVEELTDRLREFDPADPVKYDFALFGMGVCGEA